MEQTPFLQYNFSSQDGNKQSFLFTEPLQVITAETIKQVRPALAQIQEYVHQGYYAAGYLSYEAAPAFEPACRVHKDSQMPLLWFGVFKQPLEEIGPIKEGPFSVSEWKPDTSFDEYHKAITAIKRAIEQGETYQVNYTVRLHADFDGDDYAFYQRLAKNQSANYSAYLNTGRFRILSASPELFFRKDGNVVITRPMKGTAPRGRWFEEDRDLADWLYHSEKNRAENVMIVDLIRNDLGRMALPGTVCVPHLFDIETYPTVHQMTSTVQAQVKPDITIDELFAALFPCGSITGAPKIRTMDYIASLEKSPREVYCGAIGYITPTGEAVFNVPIRTAIIDKEQNKAIYGVGGGITWDSSVDGEYEEVFTKAKLLTTTPKEFDLIESLKLEDGSYSLMDEHISRLQESASYFNFSFSELKIKGALAAFAREHHRGLYKVRLLLSKNGDVTVEGQETTPIRGPVQAALAKEPIHSDNPYFYHKTTNRKIYEIHTQGAAKDIFSVLLWNEKEELTEFTFGNLVAEIDGEKVTPPVHCGLLPGTLRKKLLQEGVIKERIIRKDELARCSKIWFINSVRGWIPVHLTDDERG
ncbi:MAG: aminodeoxychorismate synthase component I [Bacillaceae bacterium]|nr:aminodeoxychorismate synthase component I [Bacillaceae bacterium]